MEGTDDLQEAEVWLDLAGERLWRGTEALRLRPKSFAVLRYLTAHPGQVVSKVDLLQAVWPETAVSDVVLMVCINELRTLLGDAAHAPRYIETVHRRGYRWIGTLPTMPQSPAPAAPMSRSTEPRTQHAVVHPPLVVGREAACTTLQAWLAQARRGVRQVGFVTGEAGLGKTTVIDTFLAQVADAPDLWLARGQCVEPYGAGEAYLPVLDALGQLCRGPDGERLVAWLAQQAPTWLVQMPALLSGAALEAVQHRVRGATRERMLRELAEALEALTSERPLVLVLEDLHWSDAATLDLVGYLARRRVPARVLLLGTYRPVEVIVRGHPLQALKLDLVLHQQCVALPLELFTAADVAQYLTARFGERAFPAALAPALYRRTDGHPLFLVTVVDALVQQGLVREVTGRWEVPGGLAVVEAVVPENLRQLIAQQFDGLSPEDQGVLEAASVAGMESTVAVMAAASEVEVEVVEARCASLVQRGQFLQAHGVEEWPDGTVTGRYGFRHVLYHQVLYERVPVARQMRLHRQIGARLEAGYGAQAGARAAEPAMHFDRGRASARAVPYWRQAAAHAMQRWAYPEALSYLRRGLEVLETLPDTPERRQQELEYHLAVGLTLSATQGLAAPETGKAYARAQTLCQHVGDLLQHLRVLWGLHRFHFGRGEIQTARALGAQCLSVAQRLQDPTLLAEAHAALGLVAFILGEIATAQEHFAQGMASYDAQQHHTHMVRYGRDPGIVCLVYGALAHWLLGAPDRAMTVTQQARTLADTVEHPMSRGNTLAQAALLHLLRGEAQTGQECAQAALTLATAYGLATVAALGTVLESVARAAQEPCAARLAQLQQALATWQATGQEPGRLLVLALVAEQYGRAGQAEAGLHLLTAALSGLHSQGPHLWEAELYRVRGTLLLQAGDRGSASGTLTPASEAETCFQHALTLARRQGARSFELRAAMGLGRLWQQQGKPAAARALLAPLYNWFTEGWHTADLQEAKALLAELGR